MNRKHLMALAVLSLCFCTAVFAQDKLGHLKSWDGKPTQEVDGNGKVTADFFKLPEVRAPLKKLLKPADFNFVTGDSTTGSPLKVFGNYLATSMCRKHNCGDQRVGLAINLTTGDMYVRMQNGTKERWAVSQGKGSDLPQEVQDYIK